MSRPTASTLPLLRSLTTHTLSLSPLSVTTWLCAALYTLYSAHLCVAPTARSSAGGGGGAAQAAVYLEKCGLYCERAMSVLQAGVGAVNALQYKWNKLMLHLVYV